MTIYKSGVWKYIKEERHDNSRNCEAEQCQREDDLQV